MSYAVTATRKRPKSFAAMLGQEFVAGALGNSIEKGRIAHAYLFAGPRGVGKTSAARILARSLNCEHGPTATPCERCANCLEIATGSSLDVIEIDGASNTGVNDIREIKDEVKFPPQSSRYKIYIIDEVHMLSTGAFNALLKTIEEPPEYVVFIFATTETHKVPATIRSRCQQYNFKLIDQETIKNALRSAAADLSIEADDDALFWLAKEAEGSMRDAYTIFDQAVAFSEGKLTLAKIKAKMGLAGMDELTRLFDLAATSSAAEALLLLNALLDDGINIEQFFLELIEYIRNLLFIALGIVKESILGYRQDLFSAKALATFSENQLEMALAGALNAYKNMKFSVTPRYEVELFIHRLCSLSRELDGRTLLERVETLRRELLADANQIDSEERAPSDTLKTAQKSPEPSVGVLPAVAREYSLKELKIALIQAVRKEKSALAASLEKADEFTEENHVLNINVNNSFEHESIAREESYLMRMLETLNLGRIKYIKVSTPERVESAPSETLSDELKSAAILKEIFQGEIIKNGS